MILANALNYSAIARNKTYEQYPELFPSQMVDSRTLFLDTLNGILYTLQLMKGRIQQGELLNIDDIFPIDSSGEYAYLALIEEYMSHFPVEFIKDQQQTIADTFENLFGQLYALFVSIAVMEMQLNQTQSELNSTQKELDYLVYITLPQATADLAQANADLAQALNSLSQAQDNITSIQTQIENINQTKTDKNNLLIQKIMNMPKL